MKLLCLAALAAGSLAMSGCTGLGRATVGSLPELEVRKAATLSCADLVDKVQQADADAKLTQQQQQALYRSCEAAQKGTIVKPEALRQGIGGVLP